MQDTFRSAGPPRDDRAWPPWAPAMSVLLALACLVGIVAAARHAAETRNAIESSGAGFARALAVVLTAVTFAAAGGYSLWRGSQAMIEGRPTPGWTFGATFGLMVLTPVPFAIGPEFGSGSLLGVLAGIFATNVAAQLSARRQRSNVDVYEAAEAEADARQDAARTTRLRSTLSRDAGLGQALQVRVAQERQYVGAWVVATAAVLSLGTALHLSNVSSFAVGAFALCFGGYALRRLVGARLAQRDFLAAKTAPRRAFIVLLSDPAPKVIRPLLAIWSERPVVTNGTLPKPDRVYRCDEEADDLLCYPGFVVVHEAWVDTGTRPSSKPRWVAANRGIALPHRRAVLGPFYVHAVLRQARPRRPEPLNVRAPSPAFTSIVEASAPTRSWGSTVGWRLLLLSAVSVGFALMTRGS